MRLKSVPSMQEWTMPWKAGSPSRRFAVVSRRFFAAAFAARRLWRARNVDLP